MLSSEVRANRTAREGGVLSLNSKVRLTGKAGVHMSLALVLVLQSAIAASVATDGERIVYSSYESGNWEIWSMKPNGSDKKQLTDAWSDEKAPALSPGAQQVAYCNNKGEIWVADADGSNGRVLPLPKGLHSDPCWTPDGSKVIVSSRLSPVEESADLYFIEVREGKNTAATRLLEMPGVEMFPDCSPDGRQIVFSHFEIKREDMKLPRPPVVEELFVLDVPTGKVEQLTTLGKNSNDPCYSPDGKWIVFSSNVAGSYDLWIVRADGADPKPTRLTDDPGFEGTACWSPDGSRIAFVSSRTGNLEIWTTDREGNDWRQVTRSEHGRDSTEPSWRRAK